MSYLIVVDRMPRGPQMFYPLDTDDVHEAMDAYNALDVAGSAVAMYDVDAMRKKEDRAMKKDRAWKNVAFLPCPICDRPLTGRNVDLYDADGNEVNPNIDEIWIDRLVMRCRCGYRLNVPECKVDTMSKGWQQRFAEAANQRASPQSLVTASSAIECFLHYWGSIPGAPEHLENALKSIDLACKAYDDLYSGGVGMSDDMSKPLVQSVAVQCYSTAIIGALSAQVMTVARMAKAAQLAIEEMPGAPEQKDVVLPMLMDVGTEMWKQLDMLRCTRTTLGRLMPGMMDEREDDA